MNFEKIKQLVKHNGDKCIVVEQGEPELVVMSFREYEKLARKNFVEQNLGGLSKPNVTTAKTDDHNEPGDHRAISSSVNSSSLPIHLEDVQLEDLPL